MNPYMETRWPDIHQRIITDIADALGTSLPPDLYAQTEEEVRVGYGDKERRYRVDVGISDNWKRGLPPVWIGGEEASGSVLVEDPYIVEMEPPAESRVEIREAGGSLVTVIEVLSVSNKIESGRQEYLKKTADYRAAGISVVEIDLLRTGRPVIPSEYLEGLKPESGTRYLITVSRAVNLPTGGKSTYVH